MASSEAKFAGILATAQHTETLASELIPSTKDSEQQLRWAAGQLEAFFVREVFNSMRRTIPEGGLFEKSFATNMYEDMLWDERAQAVVEAGGLGLREMILEQLRG